MKSNAAPALTDATSHASADEGHAPEAGNASATKRDSTKTPEGPALSQVLETVEVTIPGSLQYRDLVTRATSLVCKRLKSRGQLDSDDFMQEAVSAASEAFNNIVSHSYGGGSQGGYVTLIFHVFETTLEIVFLDYGRGARLSKQKSFEPPSSRNMARMSQYIMRTFMDEIEQQLGRPNRLHMRKHMRPHSVRSRQR